MAHPLTKPYLRRFRNDILVADLIADILKLPHKISEGRFRFLCPVCKEFDTAANPKTNLARCFCCKQNFNPIDITMLVKKLDFLATIDFLEPLLPPAHTAPHS